jgi:SAM-dependent methyltransferase
MVPVHRPGTHRAAPASPSPRALAQYRRRAWLYDVELAAFEPYRVATIGKLQLQPGQCVIDVGCGTGLSFERLVRAVGEKGRVIGIEQSPEMLAKARERVARAGWRNVELHEAPAAAARPDGPADAALFHFTHDVLRDEASVANILAHLKPGARVAACGLQWAGSWNPANGFVLVAALYSTTSLEGLDRPWGHLAAQLEGLQVEPVLQGSIYIATGRYTPR